MAEDLIGQKQITGRIIQDRVWRTAAITAVVLAISVPGYAEEPASKDRKPTVRKTEDGLHFNVPPDWPIEKRAGVTAPIPIEEYLAKKFSAIESRLQVLEQRVNGLDVRLRVQEEASKRPGQGLRSSEPAAPVSGSQEAGKN